MTNFNVNFEHEAAPKFTQHVSLKAEIQNKSSFWMLPGAANVFINGHFESKTQLNACEPKGMFSCSFGIDPSIVIEYHKLKKYPPQVCLVGENIIKRYEQVIDIKNKNTHSVRLFLIDKIPMNIDGKLPVNLIQSTVKDKNVKMVDANYLEFYLNLAPFQRTKIAIDYSIEFP
jgi:uncharacterized protein (TIGR02231 family)